MPPQAAQKLETIDVSGADPRPGPERQRRLHAARQRRCNGQLEADHEAAPACAAACNRWAELPETTPIISAFEYAQRQQFKMFVANLTKVYDRRDLGAGAGGERADVRQLRRLATRQPGRRLACWC